MVPALAGSLPPLLRERGVEVSVLFDTVAYFLASVAILAIGYVLSTAILDDVERKGSK